MATPLPSDRYERPYWTESRVVAGVDEAGRGALAGPVVAAAVILDPAAIPPGLADSKVLSATTRERLAPEIERQALAWHVCIVDVERIEAVNILQATFDAMHGAIDGLAMEPFHLFIDGNRFRPHRLPHTTIVSGDGLSVSIAAASILAKVHRDRLMHDLARTFPVYGFEQHKGYGTLRHRAMIREHGPCALHRPSFLRKI
ncbi:MAG: ribonuclease HII [Bacteroidetes bacterium]|nr:ribonuclease HII [Bacteroidota bacterium]